MAHDVKQWLDEIKALQQQLAELENEREAAHTSAEHWRELYNKEAQQRRTEAKLAQQTIESLKTKIKRLEEGFPHVKPGGTGTGESLAQEMEKLAADEAKAKLLELVRERDLVLQEVARLADALKVEQTAHIQTRESLTTALGDTMERLKAARAALTGTEGPAATGAESKSPSLMLPPINPDQSPA